MSYNLLDERWIPVLRLDGKASHVGIRTALRESGGIRQVAASNPLDNVALLRFLLAVAVWCRPQLSDRDRSLLNGVGGIPENWLTNRLGSVGRESEAFVLLGEHGGFYQDPTVEGRAVAATNLVHELPSASNVAHFRHARDGRDGLCPGCCALALLRWSAVASAGTAGAGQSMTASVNGNTPTYAIPTGKTLLQTLLRSWPTGPSVPGDAPVWAGATEDSPLGFLKGLTWRSRRVLLAPPNEAGGRLFSGHCCLCGTHTEALVRWIRFRPGWRRASAAPWDGDPHLLLVARGRRGESEQRGVVPSWPGPNAALEDHACVWRSVLEGLLQRCLASPTPGGSVETMLLASSQQLYKHIATHRVTLPPLRPEQAECLLTELAWLRQTTWATTSARSRNWSDPPRGQRVVGALCREGAKGHGLRSALCSASPLAESEMEQDFLQLMWGLSAAAGDRDAILGSWRSRAQAILRDQVDGAVALGTAGSVLRRKAAVRKVERLLQPATASGALASGGQGDTGAAGASETNHD